MTRNAEVLIQMIVSIQEMNFAFEYILIKHALFQYNSYIHEYMKQTFDHLPLIRLKYTYLHLLLVIMLLASGKAVAQQNDMLLRISEIEIHPQYLKVYHNILIEEAKASVKLEPGVLAIFPMHVQADSTKIRILEMYANKEAYQFHLTTPHFKKYKTTTLAMVKSLKLIDMNALDPEMIPAMFRK